MTNVFGSGAPQVDFIDEAGTGPLQLGIEATVAVPCVLTHIRYYVATTSMATNTGGSVTVRAWRRGEPDSTVSETLTIPGTVGWVTVELSPTLFVPADRRFGASISLPSGTQSYGTAYQVLPASNRLVTVNGSGFDYSADPLSPYAFVGNGGTSYLIDLEVAVSEMVNLDPANMVDGDVITVRRNTTGTINTDGVTAITDAYIVNLNVIGGPLDGTDVDVWIPDTVEGLAAADMRLEKETADPTIGSEWETSDGARWVYQGGGTYYCFAPGTTFDEGNKTTRVGSPSLTTWTP